jgi:hypothetical protein
MIVNDLFSTTKVASIFDCESCDYKCSNKTNFEKHLLTKKHKMISFHLFSNKSSLLEVPDHYSCLCGNNYKQRTNLYRHKKKCPIINPLNPEVPNSLNEEFIKTLLKDNQEFKQIIIEQNSKIIDIVSTPTTINNTNNNTNNNQFNLNVFLNEKCKNAMSIDDFVKSCKIKSSDLEDIGKLGYVQGISNIFIKGLKDLDEKERPIHCTDKKRETLYIKNSNGWNKDDNKERMKMVVKELAHKNFKYIPIWTDANPSYNDGSTKKNDQYMRIVNQVMTAISPEDGDVGINKIIRNVSQEIIIDKGK